MGRGRGHGAGVVLHSGSDHDPNQFSEAAHGTRSRLSARCCAARDHTWAHLSRRGAVHPDRGGRADHRRGFPETKQWLRTQIPGFR